MASYVHIWLALICAAVVSGFALLTAFNYYHPDWALTSGFFGILMLVVTSFRKSISATLQWLSPRIAWIVSVLDRNKLICTLLCLALSAGSIYGTVNMLNGFIDRYRYTNSVRAFAQAQVSEHSVIPDLGELTSNYKKFPDRPEIPILLARSGRIFSIGGTWKQFVAHQKRFSDDIFAYVKSRPDSCTLRNANYDPISFAAVSYLEASVVLIDGQPEGVQAFQNRAIEAIALLERCAAQDNPLAALVRSIYAIRIKSLLTGQNFGGHKYDVDAELDVLRSSFEELDVEIVSELYRTHAYQELLDFEIMFSLRKLASFKGSSPSVLSNTEATTLSTQVIAKTRELLALRQALARSGEVRWINVPEKLDTYRYFMRLSGYKSERRGDIHSLLVGFDKLALELKSLADSTAFKEFLVPAMWTKSTPLDPSLEGTGLTTFFDNQLKKGW